MDENKRIIPEISRISSFRKGEAIQIYGEGIAPELMNGSSGLYLWYNFVPAEETLPCSSELPKEPPEKSVKIAFDTVFNQVAYTAPSKLVRSGTAVAWVENMYGISKPFIVNQPRILSCSHKKVLCGDMIKIVGTGMIGAKRGWNTERMCKTLFLLKPETGEKFYVKNACDNAYFYNKENYYSDFVIPEGIPAGNYKAYVHNSDGGQFGWSEPIDLEIYEKQTLNEYFRNKCFDYANRHRIMPECETVIVKPDDNGAMVDMSERLQSAIDSLKNGGIVKLTSGIYGISKTLKVKSGVIIVGAGKDNTIIRTCSTKGFSDDWSDVVFAGRKYGLKRWAIDWRGIYESENSAALVRLTENCGLEDLRIEFGEGANIGVMVANINSDRTHDVFVNNIAIDSGYNTAYNPDGIIDGAVCVAFSSVCSTENLTVCSSHFKAVTPIEILPARNYNLKLINNIIECSPAQIGQSLVDGIRNSFIIGNKFLNGRRSLLMQEGCSNNFIYQNRSSGVSRSGNAQEQYMSEYGEAIWHGLSADNGENYFTIENVDRLHSKETLSEYLSEYDMYVCILDGRGFGQYREIIGNDGDRVLIDRPWDVVPDENTFLTVVKGTVDNIFLNNNTENGNGPTNFVWGCGFGNVICGHELVLSYAMTFHGYSLVSTRRDEFSRQSCGYGAVAFNEMVGCQSKASGMGIRTDTSGPSLKLKDEFYERFLRHHGIFGCVFKNNAFEGNKAECYLKNQVGWIEETYNSGMELAGAYNFVQNNLVAGYANAVKLRYDCEGNYFAKNKFLYCDNNFVFEPRHNYYGYVDDRTVGPDAAKLWFND